MDLKGEAAKALCDIELGKIQDEFYTMWHNGRIDLPDIELDSEWEEFWDCLGDIVPEWCKDTQSLIKEKTGLEWTIYQKGRSGATFYPEGYENLIRRDEITIEHIYGDTPRTEDDYYDPDDIDEEQMSSEWISAYETLRDVAKALHILNAEAKAYAQSIPEWWKDEWEYLTKEAA
jgi:hypothetical protein